MVVLACRGDGASMWRYFMMVLLYLGHGGAAFKDVEKYDADEEFEVYGVREGGILTHAEKICDAETGLETSCDDTGPPITFNEKRKKLAKRIHEVDASDVNRQAVSGGRPRRATQPHVGRSWMKHIFAGQPSLTFVSGTVLSLQVGQSLDVLPEVGGWDATT